STRGALPRAGMSDPVGDSHRRPTACLIPAQANGLGSCPTRTNQSAESALHPLASNPSVFLKNACSTTHVWIGPDGNRGYKAGLQPAILTVCLFSRGFAPGLV